MATLKRHSPLGPLVILAASLAGTALALYAYFTPLTGVTGSPGALLVVVSSVLLIIDALILWFGPPGFIFGLFCVLGLLGAIGTLAAAWFLHGWWLMAAMAVALVGLILALIPSHNSRL